MGLFEPLGHMFGRQEPKYKDPLDAIVAEFQRRGGQAEANPLIGGVAPEGRRFPTTSHQPQIVAFWPNPARAYCIMIDDFHGVAGSVHFDTIARLEAATNALRGALSAEQMIVLPVLVSAGVWDEDSTTRIAQAFGIIRVELSPTPKNAARIVDTILRWEEP